MATKELSIGKVRGLQELVNPRGHFTMLEIDHRESRRQAMRAESPGVASPEALLDRDLLLTRVLAPFASGVLLDPEYGAARAVGGNALPGSVGLAVSLEAADYEGEVGARRTTLIAGWDVGKTKRMGASAAKLLLYYHPEAVTARQQEAIAEAVAEQCRAYDLPLLLEPMSYEWVPAVPKGSSEFARQRPYVVQDSAMHLTPLGADVLLAEFPANLQYDSPLEALDQCRKLSTATELPWILVSTGQDYELYRQEVEIACSGGASGFLAGYSLWQEMTTMPQEQWEEYAATVVVDRLQTLNDVANAEARSYWPQAPVSQDWLKTYAWEPEPAIEALAD